MARNLAAKHRLCRRFGEKLCDSTKCPVVRRNYPPGVHGPKGKQRISEYGSQLLEKQKAKGIYGILERQFTLIIGKAVRQKGNSANTLYELLERRLDNVVYRLGLAFSRRQARQLVSHKHIQVNNKTVSIPSYTVVVGDSISIKGGGKKIFEANKTAVAAQVPPWLAYDATTQQGKILAIPAPDDAAKGLDFKRIIEYYSR